MLTVVLIVLGGWVLIGIIAALIARYAIRTAKRVRGGPMTYGAGAAGFYGASGFQQSCGSTGGSYDATTHHHHHSSCGGNNSNCGGSTSSCGSSDSGSSSSCGGGSSCSSGSSCGSSCGGGSSCGSSS